MSTSTVAKGSLRRRPLGPGADEKQRPSARGRAEAWCRQKNSRCHQGSSSSSWLGLGSLRTEAFLCFVSCSQAYGSCPQAGFRGDGACPTAVPQVLLPCLVSETLGCYARKAASLLRCIPWGNEGAGRSPACAALVFQLQRERPAQDLPPA